MSEGAELRGKREILKQELRSKKLTVDALRNDIRRETSPEKDATEIKWDDVARLSIDAARIAGEMEVIQDKLDRIADILGRD